MCKIDRIKFEKRFQALRRKKAKLLIAWRAVTDFDESQEYKKKYYLLKYKMEFYDNGRKGFTKKGAESYPLPTKARYEE